MLDRRSPGALSCFLRVYWHSLFGRASGGPIFRCTTKDRGERRAKGLRPLESPGVNVLGHSDVLCANRSATVRVTRLSRLRCREANTLGVRSAYPLASACCGAVKLVALQQLPNFRLQIRLVILSVPTFLPQSEQYNRVRGSSAEHATDGPKSR